MGCKCSNENPIEEEIIKEEKKKVDFNESYSEISKQQLYFIENICKKKRKEKNVF